MRWWCGGYDPSLVYLAAVTGSGGWILLGELWGVLVLFEVGVVVTVGSIPAKTTKLQNLHQYINYIIQTIQ